MIRLHWTELSFDLVPEAPWTAPAFPGSMYRGALAMALRRLVCVMRRPSCEGCPLVAVCLYPRLFETRPEPAAGVMRLYDRAPHPIVIDAALQPPPGPGEQPGPSAAGRSPVAQAQQAAAAPAAETLTLRLFGPDVAAAPYLAHAAREMAARGLGRARVPFRLAGLRGAGGVPLDPGGNLAPPPPAPEPPALPPRRRWRIESPLRLVSGGRPVDATRIDGSVIGRAILRRVGLMAQFYGEGAEGLDFAALAGEAARLRLRAAELAWVPLRRWSSRQGAAQSIGGLMGTLELDFAEAPQLARLADWVPVLHLGKETSMGLGRIRAEAA